MTQRIALIRHGRSAHVHTGLLDAAGFRLWRDRYEAAGIVDGDMPPPEVRQLAAGAIIVASDAPRAIESAKVIADGRQLLVTPLLRELDLVTPHIPWIRLPLIGWALLVGVRSLLRRTHATPAEAERARAAAEWLSQLSRTHGTVVAVTHAIVRGAIAQELLKMRWNHDVERRGSHHWSAWVLSARDQ